MNRSSRHIVSFAFAVIFAAGSAAAAPSPKYQEWRNGPVRWIMTDEEQRAWKRLENDQQASDFIDLFWARRDPSPGTTANAFRDEFYGRVRFADQNFKEDDVPGSMTDRGRVYIVLGNPTHWNVEVRSSNAADSGTAGMTEGGTRLRAGKDTWLWEGADARKFDRPKIEVVFIQKVGTNRRLRDPLRADYLGAEPVAIRKAIVNKDLVTVPEWAIFGGLDPKMKVERDAPATPSAAGASGTVIDTATVRFSTTAEGDAAPVSGLSTVAGASRLTLLQNVYDIDTETGKDPFADMKASDVYTSADEMGWAAQYCAPEDEPLVRFALLLTGRIGNEIVERAAPPDEMVPDRIRANPGCFMLRGAIPLEGMSAGSYELELQILDGSDLPVQTMKRAFRIE